MSSEAPTQEETRQNSESEHQSTFGEETAEPLGILKSSKRRRRHRKHHRKSLRWGPDAHYHPTTRIDDAPAASGHPFPRPPEHLYGAAPPGTLALEAQNHPSSAKEPDLEPFGIFVPGNKQRRRKRHHHKPFQWVPEAAAGHGAAAGSNLPAYPLPFQRQPQELAGDPYGFTPQGVLTAAPDSAAGTLTAATTGQKAIEPRDDAISTDGPFAEAPTAAGQPVIAASFPAAYPLQVPSAAAVIAPPSTPRHGRLGRSEDAASVDHDPQFIMRVRAAERGDVGHHFIEASRPSHHVTAHATAIALLILVVGTVAVLTFLAVFFANTLQPNTEADIDTSRPTFLEDFSEPKTNELAPAHPTSSETTLNATATSHGSRARVEIPRSHGPQLVVPTTTTRAPLIR